ncbi:MAG: ATP-binding cassette domain-containing protein [Candidatus Bipolaricaulia bacterium]
MFDRPVLPLYSLRGVVKSYSGHEIVHVDRLDIDRHEVFTVLGPSGAGKSTLLRMLALLETPNDGALVMVDSAGEILEVNHRDPHHSWRRKVVMVFQHPILVDRTVYSNVAYGLRLRGEKVARDRVRELLGELQLLDLEHARAHTLSAGEVERVAMARALLVEPEVLLLDEPTANLDPYNVGLVEDAVRAIREQRRATVVLVTHNVFQARRIASRVALMLQGRITEVSTGEVFFDHPKDERTAAFLRGELVYEPKRTSTTAGRGRRVQES